LLGTFFDRDNGLFALAPVYLLALPGVALLARDRPRRAVVLLLLEAALVVDVMREEDGRSLDVPICAALRQSVTSETGAGGVPIHSNVYHLLGRWHARV